MSAVLPVLPPVLMPRLLLATRSGGKLRELVPLLGAHGFAIETLEDAGIPEHPDEETLEGFETFEENALAKARWFSGRAPGRVVLADDSGLVVPALGGRPGVRSKRWSDRPDLVGTELDRVNNQMLLSELSKVSATGAASRAAWYACAAAAVWDGGERIESGRTMGHILELPEGDGGFGYDPYFHSDDLGMSFGEADIVSKGTVSHRARAFERLADALRKLLAPR